MNNVSLTPEQRVKLGCRDILKSKFSFLAPFVLMVSWEVDDELDTARTDGRVVTIGKKLLVKLPRKQLHYVMLHEVVHNLLFHPFYKFGLDADSKLVNIAMDFVVNSIIEEVDKNFEFVERPVLVKPLIDKRFKGWSFKQVYDHLKNDQEKAGGGGFDEHCFNKDGKPEEGSVGNEDTDNLKEVYVSARKEVIQQLKEDEALRMALAESLKLDITPEKSVVNFRKALRNVLSVKTDGCSQGSFHPADFRFSHLDTLIPKKIDMAPTRICIAGDTSGSMEEFVSKNLAEVVNVLKSFPSVDITLIWWDTEVRSKVRLKADDLRGRGAKALKSTVVGGGGTRVSCTFEEISKGYDVVIYLTDGMFCDIEKIVFPKRPLKVFVVPTNEVGLFRTSPVMQGPNKIKSVIIPN